MGKNMKHLLLFAIKYRGWHYWAKNRPTYDAVHRLYDQGFIEINKWKQFRLTEPGQNHESTNTKSPAILAELRDRQGIL